MSNWIPSMWQRTASMSPEFDVRHTPAVSIRPSQIESGEVAQDGMFNSAVDGIADRRLNLGLQPQSLHPEHGNAVPRGQMGHGVTWDTPGAWRGVPVEHIEEARALGIRPDQYLSGLRDYGLDHEVIIGPKNRALINKARGL